MPLAKDVPPITREQREELERLEREARSPAAPLPWKVSDLDWRSVEDAEERVVVDLRVSGADGGADISRLIPAMRNALPSLLASARRLEELEGTLGLAREFVTAPETSRLETVYVLAHLHAVLGADE